MTDGTRAAMRFGGIVAASRPLRLGVLSLTGFVALVLLVPRMPGSELDLSWMLALNQAVAQGLRFGDQVAFTFGPYAATYTAMYHPATDGRMLASSCLIGAAYAVALSIVFKRSGWICSLSYCAALTALVFYREVDGAPPVRFIARDALYFSYYLLLICVCMRKRGGVPVGSSVIEDVATWALFVPLGLLPLMKGSFLVLSLAVGATCVAYLLVARRRLLGLACAAAVPLAMLGFWSMAEQPVAGLWSYLESVAYILAGYTDAMQVTGPALDILAYLAVACILVAAIAFATKAPKVDRAFLMIGFGLILFTTFKSAFVRHDIHVLVAGTLVPLAAIALAAVLRTPLAAAAALAALAFAGYVDRTQLRASPADFLANATATYGDFARGLRVRVLDPDGVKKRYLSSLDDIARPAALTDLREPTDIYSYGQSGLIASGVPWAPRPTLQSYAAFVPRLARMNREHLQGSAAPQNIVFKVQPIDDRFPATEDGQSWPVLLSDYHPAGRTPLGLLLRRNVSSPEPTPATTLIEGSGLIGDRIAMPESQRPLFARLRFHETLVGRGVAVLYKLPILSIDVELANGQTLTYRLVSAMAASGFILSPLIRTESDFAALSAEPRSLDGYRVRSFAVRMDGPPGLWASRYDLRLDRLP